MVVQICARARRCKVERHVFYGRSDLKVYCKLRLRVSHIDLHIPFEIIFDE